MRLIDADVLIELIESGTDLEFDEVTEKALVQMIKEQNIAFDVKKVVEQLEEATVSGMGGVGFNKNVYEIIDIVKRGGADLGYNPYQE